MNRRLFLFFGPLFLAISILGPATEAIAGSNEELNRTAKELSENIVRLNLQKIYVPDFINSSGLRTDKSVYLAALFSKMLTEHAKTFQVVDRASVQKSYDALKLTAQDLEKPEVQTKLGVENGADSSLWGTVTELADEFAVDLIARDISGKGLYTKQYREPKTPSLVGLFPAISDSSGRVFYFSGFDGVSMPKCLRCPNPGYTDEARRHKIQGAVILPVVFTAEGKVENLRVVQTFDPSLGQASLDTIRNWKVAPSKDSAGTPVSVRIQVDDS